MLLLQKHFKLHSTSCHIDAPIWGYIHLQTINLLQELVDYKSQIC